MELDLNIIINALDFRHPRPSKEGESQTGNQFGEISFGNPIFDQANELLHIDEVERVSAGHFS